MNYRLPGLVVTDHTLAVPLDHADPGRGTIEVFAREVVDPARVDQDLPWLLYLQGGPGGKAPRPTAGNPSWLRRALRTHRVLLMDQRGTGRSTPVTGRTAARFPSAEAFADHLACFRADAIVADAEALRHAVAGGRPWETLGQSYGGFLTLTYLSQAPEGLTGCYVTGGLPGLDATAEDVYRATAPRVAAKNAAFAARYPGDQDVLRRLAQRLAKEPARLPDGDLLTVRRLRFLGLELGMGAGFERLHWLLDEALDADGAPTDVFLSEVAQLTGFVANPLFGVLHESIYGQPGSGPTAWAAQRVLDSLPQFAEDADPLLLTGEMILPWMFEDVTALRPFAEAAQLLADRADWPALYDRDRLAANRVPVAAAVYFDDMYVDAQLSLRTAAEVGSVRTWVTNEWEHDGVRVDGERVLGRLMDMVAGQI
ncbi:alpha/beta fold hydrolase [Streptacidiphilus jiangxiensis]|uniref:Alpha/beta hydrolase fold n=1 Tax=Streptacidiphilus jiangxiensis TaxID=235985 RepID=A0A1H7YL44_STRJI|nr:alpha/beta fold hydrolase [Streptacidiphilus jiangxiensis]SEM46554.1 alpha/beta hydrolase fold [Streptacidiphilus jiangxiensis]